VPHIQSTLATVYAREGSALTIPVAVTGEGPLSYQWWRFGEPIMGATSPSLALNPITMDENANYSVQVSNTYGSASALIAMVRVHNEYQTNYAEWAAAHFSPAELANPSISGPTADPDGCGLTNLARYAFKTAARGPLSAHPVTTQVVRWGDDYSVLELSFRRKTHAPGLRYLVESAADLAGPWNVRSAVDAGYPEEIAVRDNVGLEQAPRRFMRVRIEQSP
jgi:hypothetical protein